MNGFVQEWRKKLNSFAERHESIKAFWLVPAVLFMISGIKAGTASGATWFDTTSTALALSDMFCWGFLLVSINDIECDIRMSLRRSRRKAVMGPDEEVRP
jgi:hypothetical protein